MRDHDLTDVPTIGFYAWDAEYLPPLVMQEDKSVSNLKVLKVSRLLQDLREELVLIETTLDFQTPLS